VTIYAQDGQGNKLAGTEFWLNVGQVFLVTNTGDNGGIDPSPGAGTGTLRQAIVDANNASATGEPSLIAFAIPTTDPGYNPATGAFTIALLGPPGNPMSVNVPAIIDGYTQPGASPNTLAVGDNAVLPITLDGSVQEAGLFADADNTTVRGLTIQNCFFIALFMNGPNNLVQGNFITTTMAYPGGGTSGMGVGLGGGAFDGEGKPIGSMSNTILGGTSAADRNVISGYASDVTITNETTPGAPGAVVEGNYIGTNAAGTGPAVYPGEDGVDIASDNNTIEDNLISGNAGPAVASSDLADGPAGITLTGNVIEGNLIGTDVSGTQPIPNGAGIVLASSFYYCDPSINTLIGGTSPGEGNTIAFNDGPGVGPG
jgi:hypothetical protein